MSESPESSNPAPVPTPGPALSRAQALLAARWLNSPPLFVAQPSVVGEAELHFIHPALADRPVLLHFWDFTCIHCLRTLPYLRAWNLRYAAAGLTIIGVHTPKFSFGGKRRHVEAAVRDFGVRYPVVIDADYTIWRALGGECWPRTILLDRAGQAVFEHSGEGAYPELETKVQEVLRDGHRDLALPALLGAVRAADVTGTVPIATTPELYCGSLRGAVGNGEGLDAGGGTVDYTDVTRRVTDTIYLAGPWQATDESVCALPAAGRPAVLKLRCAAAGVNAVLRGLERPMIARVTVDGRSVTEERRGADLVSGPGGQTLVEAGEPRMYQLLGGPGHRKNELAIEVEQGRLEVFAFSFVSSVKAA